MVVRRSNLRSRADRGPGSRNRKDVGAQGGSAFGDAVRRVLTGSTAGAEKAHELNDLALPDLLSPAAGPGPDTPHLRNLIDLAFLGRAAVGEIDREIEEMFAGDSMWQPDLYFDDLFLSELVRGCFRIDIEGRNLPCHREFIERVLANPPADVATTRYRQAILRELDQSDDINKAFENVMIRSAHLLMLLRAARDDARLKPVRFRLDVLRSLRSVVDVMNEGFANTRSGLQRLHGFASVLGASPAYQKMIHLLDHQAGMASLKLGATIGADGKLRHLEIEGLKELKNNPFFKRPLRRWWDRLRIFYHRYDLGADEMVDRLVMGIYQEIAPALVRIVQLLGHLETYQAVRGFAAEARSRGLEICLPEIAPGARLELDRLFNPLLMAITRRPIASDLVMESTTPVNLVTGPNSGGKTRLLQAVGIAQVLGQSGFYVPCKQAKLPVVSSIFASIIEVDRADQSEGRLGTELMRLRTLFESVPPGALILLDELCSGTNPSEAIEIVETVLRLLERIKPIAFVTTHFLDFAQKLSTQDSTNGLAFLQAEVDGDRGATYRFVRGVATTSLAVGTAERLGMTFNELERRLNERN